MSIFVAAHQVFRHIAKKEVAISFAEQNSWALKCAQSLKASSRKRVEIAIETRTKSRCSKQHPIDNYVSHAVVKQTMFKKGKKKSKGPVGSSSSRSYARQASKIAWMSTANTTGRCEMQIEKTLRLQTYMDKIDIIKFDLGSHDCFKKARTKHCCKKLVFLTLASNAKLTCFLLTMKHVNIYIYI